MERKSIVIEKWPHSDKALVKNKVEEDFNVVRSIIISIRNIRSDMNIPPTAKFTVYLKPLKKDAMRRLDGAIDYIKNLARLDGLVIDEKIEKPSLCATAVLEDFNVFIPLKGVIDVDAEKARLIRKREELETQLKFTEKRLKDKNFITKAPDEIVSQEKEKGNKLKEQIKRLEETLHSLD
jgi:valyl-tRNA synthetase